MTRKADTINIKSTSHELRLDDFWNSELVRLLIDRKTAEDRTPAFLFLGNHEADLLRDHLGCAFGPESVRTLKNLYYMGMQVIEVGAPSYFRTVGTKRVRGLEEALGRTPNHHDLEASSFWYYAVL